MFEEELTQYDLTWKCDGCGGHFDYDSVARNPTSLGVGGIATLTTINTNLLLEIL